MDSTTVDAGNEENVRLRSRVDRLEGQLQTLMESYLELNLALDMYLSKTQTDMQILNNDPRTFREQLDASWEKVFASLAGEDGG